MKLNAQIKFVLRCLFYRWWLYGLALLGIFILDYIVKQQWLTNLLNGLTMTWKITDFYILLMDDYSEEVSGWTLIVLNVLCNFLVCFITDNLETAKYWFYVSAILGGALVNMTLWGGAPNIYEERAIARSIASKETTRSEQKRVYIKTRVEQERDFKRWIFLLLLPHLIFAAVPIFDPSNFSIYFSLIWVGITTLIFIIRFVFAFMASKIRDMFRKH